MRGGEEKGERRRGESERMIKEKKRWVRQRSEWREEGGGKSKGRRREHLKSFYRHKNLVL